MILALILALLICTPATAGVLNVGKAHDRLLAESEGYFKHAGGTGGQGGEVYYVTHLGDSGPGSLREAMESTEALIVLFEDGLDGTINLFEHIKVESNKTLWGRHRDGSSADILIHPANVKSAFTINDGNRNVIFSNLRADANFGVDDAAPDWLRVSETGGIVWVDHVTAIGDGSDAMDGFADIHTAGVTLSWNRVENWDAVHRIASEDGETTTVTLHHNLFRNNQGRQPRLSAPDTFAHAYNNWLVGWRGHGMQAINGGELLAENNFFTADDDDDAILGNWAGSGNEFLNGAVAVPQSPGIFTPPYAYTLDPTDTLRSLLEANAGWQSFGAVPEPPSIVLFLLGCLFFQREWYRR